MRDRRRPVAKLVAASTAAFLLAARLASAQPPDSPAPSDPALSSITTRVPTGATVLVTDAQGGVVKGTLAAVGSHAIELRTKSGPRTVAASDLQRIQWQQTDSLLNGTLIGAGIGAIPGVYWLIADPNECAGLCAEDYVAIGVGAVVGALVDRAIKRRVTVYESSGGGRGRRVAIVPLAGTRTGLQVALKF
jgi:hypothetical protein